MNRNGNKSAGGGRSSLFSRFAASSALLAAAVIVLAVIFFQALHGDFFKASFEEPLADWSSMIAARIAEDPDIADRVARVHELGLILVRDGESVAFAPSGESVDPDTLWDNVSGHRVIEVEGHGGWRIYFFLDQDRFARTHYTLLGGLIAFLLLAIAVFYFLQLNMLRPLRCLRDGVDAVSRGDFSTRVPVARMDEIGQVARAFNEMTRRVEQMINDHDRLMADVSHELRSPMARIKVALELLPDSDKRDEISRDVREMEALTAVLLERERVRGRADRLETKSVDLVTIVREAVKGYEGRAPGIVERQFPDRVVLEADAALIRVLVQNLLDNALKFSGPDSRAVEVGLAAGENHAVLVVDDDGPGIPAAEVERVLEPFVKLDMAWG
jgi:signal transduction histidine kinase